jgi:hypothetical protein
VVCGELEVVAGAGVFVLGALAAEPFHKPHDAVGESAVGQLEGGTWRGQGVVNLGVDKTGRGNKAGFVMGEAETAGNLLTRVARRRGLEIGAETCSRRVGIWGCGGGLGEGAKER